MQECHYALMGPQGDMKSFGPHTPNPGGPGYTSDPDSSRTSESASGTVPRSCMCTATELWPVASPSDPRRMRSCFREEPGQVSQKARVRQQAAHLRSFAGSRTRYSSPLEIVFRDRRRGNALGAIDDRAVLPTLRPFGRSFRRKTPVALNRLSAPESAPPSAPRRRAIRTAASDVP